MIRNQIVAGTFYPANKEKLKSLILKFLNSAKLKLDHKPKALIVPHAGYIYSGPIAGFGYKVIENFKYQKVILLGPSHFFNFQGLALSQFQWQSPLGKIETFNPKNLLTSCQNLFFINENIHQPEHCLEVQLPFLQTIYKNFKILPILTGDFLNYQKIAFCLNKILDNDTLLIISSDLSHYLPYSQAQDIDSKTVKYILNKDSQNFEKYGQACGKSAILILLEIAKINKWQADLLVLANSGDTSKIKDKVVGYSSIVFY